MCFSRALIEFKLSLGVPICTLAMLAAKRVAFYVMHHVMHYELRLVDLRGVNC